MRKINLKGKKIFDYTQEELEKRRVLHRVMFWCYCLGALGIAIIGSYTLYPIFNDFMALNTDSGSKLLLLLGLFGIINFFLLLWVWMTNESSYYKMEQEFTELMMYLKEKTE
jgi:hypothetical protein